MEHIWKFTHQTLGTRNGIEQEITHFVCMDCGATKSKGEPKTRGQYLTRKRGQEKIEELKAELAAIRAKRGE